MNNNIQLLETLANELLKMGYEPITPFSLSKLIYASIESIKKSEGRNEIEELKREVAKLKRGGEPTL